MRRTAVIGLDGATWSVLGPVLDAGVMPALAALLDRSSSGTLRSSVPPYTPPAWTSAVTGVNPGRHGVFGFVQGRREPRLTHMGMVRAPALWNYLEREGATVGLFHLPLTYPPPAVNGWTVGAVWMPTGKAITGYTHPPELERWIEELVPDYAPVSGIEIFEDWRRPDLAERIARTVADRRVALEAILERHPVDVVWAVLEAPDRLQHAYYKYLAPTESAWGSPEAREPRDAVMRALAEVDRIVGLLDAYAGPQGVAIVCSDHGATGWEGYAFGNVLLARAGLLQLRSSARVLRTIGASGFGAIARRFVPTRVTYRVRRRVQSLIDQRRTQAYAMLLGSQGFSVNLAGREASGAVPRGEMESVVADLMGALRGARTPQGDPLFSSIRRREQVYEGPFADEAPDVVVETVGSRWEVSDALATKELFQDLSALPLGCHEPNGIFALRAPGVVPATARHARIEDLLPTLLYAAGAAVPEGLDGEPRRDLFGAAAPAVTLLPSNLIGASTRGGSPYSREEEALITKYLTDLGYLG